MTTILLVLLVFVSSVVLAACCLWLGARWSKIPHATFGRALCAQTAMAGLLSLMCPLVLIGQDTFSSLPVVVLPAGLGLVVLLLTWLLIRWLLRVSFLKAVLAWLPTLLAVGVVGALVWLVVRPYALEAYVLASNSMAPTFRGPHHAGTCPHCGGLLVISCRHPDQGSDAPARLSVCASCWRSARPTSLPTEVIGSDRVLVNKLLTPQRWDSVLFQPAEGPAEAVLPDIPYTSQRWIKRVVGLPGEEVIIKDPAIWIDGKRQEPPAAIAGIRYTADVDALPGLWGTPERPARLGPDEYFVIGDFVQASFDSRLSPEGYPGRPPYAVPRSHILGVVAVVYWPPPRWGILR